MDPPSVQPFQQGERHSDIARARIRQRGPAALVVGFNRWPILGQRPEGLPPAEVRAKMLRPEDVAGAIAWILALPPHVCINELQISPTSNYHYAGMRPA